MRNPESSTVYRSSYIKTLKAIYDFSRESGTPNKIKISANLYCYLKANNPEVFGVGRADIAFGLPIEVVHQTEDLVWCE